MGNHRNFRHLQNLMERKDVNKRFCLLLQRLFAMRAYWLTGQPGLEPDTAFAISST